MNYIGFGLVAVGTAGLVSGLGGCYFGVWPVFNYNTGHDSRGLWSGYSTPFCTSVFQVAEYDEATKTVSWTSSTLLSGAGIRTALLMAQFGLTSGQAGVYANVPAAGAGVWDWDTLGNIASGFGGVGSAPKMPSTTTLIGLQGTFDWGTLGPHAGYWFVGAIVVGCSILAVAH